MLEPLALPTMPEHTFKVGDVVENFGTIGRVLELRPEPYADMVLQQVGKRMKWCAVPSKCRLVR
jgi:hypothetical protein